MKITQDFTQEEIVSKISQSVIANQIALDFNHEIRFTPNYKHNLANSLKTTNRFLIAAEKKEFSKLLDEAEDEAVEICDIQNEMIKEISSLGMLYFGVILEMVKTLKKNPKAMEIAVNEINNKHE